MVMVRFRVIKGSHLLLGVAVVALALVVCLLAFRLFAVEDAAGAAQTSGSLVEEDVDDGAKTARAVFASSTSGGILSLIHI